MNNRLQKQINSSLYNSQNSSIAFDMQSLYSEFYELSKLFIGLQYKFTYISLPLIATSRPT